MQPYNFRAPSLPIPTAEYAQKQQDQFQNALRLYFNRLDTFNLNVTIPNFGPSSARPTEGLLVGQTYFDTTLGIPIWWNGLNWINAIGEPLIYLTGVTSVARVGTAVATTFYPVVGVTTIGAVGTVTVTTI
jgi:hypothetical protein